MEAIKLIWDFRGPESHQTAVHHEIHLKEFALREKLDLNQTGVEQFSELWSSAFILTTKEQMIKLRDTLKPHRGQKITL